MIAAAEISSDALRTAHAVGDHPAGGDGGLRAGAAFEQAARDQKPIGALFGHDNGRVGIAPALSDGVGKIVQRDAHAVFNRIRFCPPYKGII